MTRIAVKPVLKVRRWSRVQRRRVLLCAVALAVAALVRLRFDSILRTVQTAAADMAGASVGWLAAGLVLTIASIVTFGVLRQRTLAAAGATLSLRTATSISYAAGAVNLTAPAGGIFSTGYAVRRFRYRRIAAGAITFSMAVTGILGTAALIVLGAAGVLLRSSDSSGATLAEGAVGWVLAVAAICLALRKSALVLWSAEWVLRRGNRLLHRPAEAGVDMLRHIWADLRAIRPTRAQWAGAGAIAVLNWLLDFGCLLACAKALGLSLSVPAALTAYAIAMGAAGLSPLPGGIGLVDGVLVLGLAGGRASVSAALIAVVLYRLLSNGSVIVIGWLLIAARSARTASGGSDGDAVMPGVNVAEHQNVDEICTMVAPRVGQSSDSVARVEGSTRKKLRITSDGARVTSRTCPHQARPARYLLDLAAAPEASARPVPPPTVSTPPTGRL